MTSSTPSEESKASYEELKFKGPPLYKQGTLSDDSFLPKTKLPLDASRTALLIVDVQPEYWSQCPAVRKDFSDFPSHLSSLVTKCRQQHAKCIWVRADYRYSHSPWLSQFARLHHEGTIPSEVVFSNETAEWEDFATPQADELVIPKTSWSSTSQTSLVDTLAQSGIDTVLVCGLITSVCVQHSAFGIFEAGYRTILVTDACADRGRARHDAALALYGDYMYELMTTQQVEGDLEAAKPFTNTNSSTMVRERSLNSVQDYIVETKKAVEEEDSMSTRSGRTGSVSSIEEEEIHDHDTKNKTVLHILG